MESTRSVDRPLGEIGAGFAASFYRRLTRGILQLFPDNGWAGLASAVIPLY